MFKNLHTATKLFILCGLFIVALGVATYQLVVEKKIAIDFARKELVGVEYLVALRDAYVAALIAPPGNASTGPTPGSRTQVLDGLASAEATAGRTMHTAELATALAAGLSELWAGEADRTRLDVLAKAARLVVRIGDDSNLTLDPDLDTYYLQDTVVTKIPALVGQLSELQSVLGQVGGADSPSPERRARALIVDGLLGSTMDEIRKNLASAYSGNPDGSLRRAVDSTFTTMLSASTANLDRLRTRLDDTHGIQGASIERPDADSAKLAIDAWAAAQAELARLLQQRINGLVNRLYSSIALIGTLALLCIVFAAMTYHYIARPLEQFERVVKQVRETRDYNLRIERSGDDEIGKLAAAFNDMLSELVAVRAQESSDHLELGHVARFTTMGGMTASLAHELKQPLAAIAANAHAGLRWLERATPNVDEARQALTDIVGDVDRTTQVIESIRSIFKKDKHNRRLISVNDLIPDVLALAHGRLMSHRIAVTVELGKEIPHVLADRVQLQQVILNLIMNGVDAMGAIEDRQRSLVIKSECRRPSDVLVMVQDAGTGIGADDMDRIFDPFFTTKSNGMGMGLFICRSIIEAHGGRLWASAGVPHGAIFQVVLPSADDPTPVRVESPSVALL
jgi:signal transduction histidine kinase